MSNQAIIDRTTYEDFYQACAYFDDEIHYKLQYPKKTHEAITEMLERGIEMNYKLLSYYIRAGLVKVGKDGKDYLWGKKEIDSAIELFAERGIFTDRAKSCIANNYDHGQFQKAFLGACLAIGKNVVKYADPWDATIILRPCTNFSVPRVVEVVLDAEAMKKKILDE